MPICAASHRRRVDSSPSSAVASTSQTANGSQIRSLRPSIGRTGRRQPPPAALLRPATTAATGGATRPARRPWPVPARRRARPGWPARNSRKDGSWRCPRRSAPGWRPGPSTTRSRTRRTRRRCRPRRARRPAGAAGGAHTDHHRHREESERGDAVGAVQGKAQQQATAHCGRVAPGPGRGTRGHREQGDAPRRHSEQERVGAGCDPDGQHREG